MSDIVIKRLDSGEINTEVYLTEQEYAECSRYVSFIDCSYVEENAQYKLVFVGERDLFLYARLFEAFDFTRKLAYAYVRYKLYHLFGDDDDVEALLALIHRRTLLSIITDMHYMV